MTILTTSWKHKIRPTPSELETPYRCGEWQGGRVGVGDKWRGGWGQPSLLRAVTVSRWPKLALRLWGCTDRGGGAVRGCTPAVLTLAVGALARALCSSRRALSYSLFSLSSLTAANQISSLFGFAWNASARMLRAADTSPWQQTKHRRDQRLVLWSPYALLTYIFCQKVQPSKVQGRHETGSRIYF